LSPCRDATSTGHPSSEESSRWNAAWVIRVVLGGNSTRKPISLLLTRTSMILPLLMDHPIGSGPWDVYPGDRKAETICVKDTG